METQMPHHNGRTGDDPHDTGLQAAGMEGEDHPKKSVIKKVKAKAKKIKDKLTPQAHGGHDHPDQHAGHDDEEEDDDEDDEMVQGPEIHGAPIYDSAPIRSGVAGPGANTGQLPAGGNYLERPSVKEEERHHDSDIYDPPVREENSGLGRPTENHDPHGSFNPNVAAPASDLMGGHGQDINTDQSKDKTGELPAIEEDPHAPKHRPGATAPSDYESKVADPAGGGGNVAGITHSLDKMGIYDEKPKQGEETKMFTGSHDQLAPEQAPKLFNHDKPEELPRDTLTGHQNQPNQSSYRDQISSATSAIAGKAVASKDAIATKLGYKGANSNIGSTPENTKSASPTGYASKIAATVSEKLTPVYEKAANVAGTVMLKVQGPGTESGTEQQTEKGPDKGVSVTTSFKERMKPGDEDKALSDVITHAFKRGNGEKRKEPAAKSSDEGRPISDAVHKQGGEGEVAGEGRQLGKVTESEEVNRQLGTGEEHDEKGKEQAAKSSGEGRPISDAVHKQGGEGEVAGEGRQPGKVTESEEVKRQLGTGEEHEHSGGGVSNAGAQKGMADRLKGTVYSWMGRGGGEPQSTETTVTDGGLSSSGGGHNAAGERKLQESTY